MDNEQYRSHIVEQFCPHVGKKVLGFVTYKFIPGNDLGNGSQVRLRQELVRAECLQLEQCPSLGCQTGLNPIAG